MIQLIAILYFYLQMDVSGCSYVSQKCTNGGENSLALYFIWYVIML